MLSIKTGIVLLLVASAVLLATTVQVQVQVRRGRVAFVDLQHALAARARRAGHLEEAWLREAIADVPTHQMWPFRPRPVAAFEVPTEIATVDRDLTDEEYQQLKARWEEQLRQSDAYRITIVPQPRTQRRRMRWWR